MINKIIGLVLITPFITTLLNLKIYCEQGSNWTGKESLINWLIAYSLLTMFEAFGVGLYFLFK